MYQSTKRKINNLPAPKFEVGYKVKSTAIGNGDFDGHITNIQFMHDEWWYVVNGYWYAESTLGIA